MKTFYLTLVAAFAFAIALTECDPIDKSANLISLTVLSADTNTFAYFKVNVTALNSEKPLVLPLNSTETNGITKVAYQTPYAPDNKPPLWNETFGISADLFNDQTYITLELYGFRELNWIVSFRGGAELTVGQIKQKPRNFDLPLIDKYGKSVGTIKLAWQ